MRALALVALVSSTAWSTACSIEVKAPGDGGMTSGGPACAGNVAAGMDHACAVKTDGTVWCWGNGNFGELGNAATDDANAPVQVMGVTGAKQVSAGGTFSCALDMTGAISCWGKNDSGQLGDGTMSDSRTASHIASLTGATQIASGYGHSCALLGDGSVTCWGRDQVGQLGDGVKSELVPVGARMTCP